MNLFYAPPEHINLPTIRLGGQEARHASKVLRVKKGDAIHITDGRGQIHRCLVESVGKDDVVTKVQSTHLEPPAHPFATILIGLIKKRDRLEFAIEKCVELGADRLIVFRGEHSEKSKVRLDRLEASAQSAMKQSLRAYLPSIQFEPSLKSALQSATDPGVLIHADETIGQAEAVEQDERYTVVIGPEGGFSEKERELLNAKGSRAYSLGEKRLRTETAAIAMADRIKNGLLR
jgi:16S rRNA (uracil1498-N3)-methyltransferase